MEINLMNLIIGAVICIIVWYVISAIPLQEPFKKIVFLLYGLFVFIWLLGALGIWSGGTFHIGG